MGGILNLLRKIEALDLDQVATKAITETKESITASNRDQMFAGIRSDGSEILPSYTDYTIFLKEEKGQPFDRVTLYDTGDFYSGMFTDVKNGSVITDSVDEKTEKLKKKYSKSKGSIFGIGGKYKKDYIVKYLQPAWNGLVQQATGLKMK